MRPTAKFDRERAVRLLLYAEEYGDSETSRKYGVSRQTLYNYRKRLAADKKLEVEKAILREQVNEGWKEARIHCLRDGIEKLRQLIAQAGVRQLDDVSKALERIGNLDITHQVLTINDTAANDRESASATEGARRYTASGQEDTSQADILQ